MISCLRGELKIIERVGVAGPCHFSFCEELPKTHHAWKAVVLILLFLLDVVEGQVYASEADGYCPWSLHPLLELKLKWLIIFLLIYLLLRTERRPHRVRELVDGVRLP